jgi:hypothetical protein
VSFIAHLRLDLFFFCADANDGECDDGSTGGTAYCSAGTDASDCHTSSSSSSSSGSCRWTNDVSVTLREVGMYCRASRSLTLPSRSWCSSCLRASATNRACARRDRTQLTALAILQAVTHVATPTTESVTMAAKGGRSTVTSGRMQPTVRALPPGVRPTMIPTARRATAWATIQAWPGATGVRTTTSATPTDQFTASPARILLRLLSAQAVAASPKWGRLSSFTRQQSACSSLPMGSSQTLSN